MCPNNLNTALYASSVCEQPKIIAQYEHPIPLHLLRICLRALLKKVFGVFSEGLTVGHVKLEGVDHVMQRYKWIVHGSHLLGTVQA